MEEKAELLVVNEPEQELVIENLESVGEAFQLPHRNWNLIVDAYNSKNKKKFPFTALQCRVILEYVKKGLRPQDMFQTLGVSPQRYGNFVSNCSDLEDKFIELQSKSELSAEEYEQFKAILKNPIRILISDVQRAQGISNLKDWERFNEMAFSATDLQAVKMRSKFKDHFNDRETEVGGSQVVINLGSDFISKL